jgi:hypothetical protein
MISLSQYRENAKDCMRWATQAKSEKERINFLGMAKAWTEVALAQSGATEKSESAFKTHAMKWHTRSARLRNIAHKTIGTRRQRDIRQKFYATGR